MIVGVPTELYPGERRVALIPDVLPSLTKKGFEILVQAGAGYSAGFTDDAYKAKGATIVADRGELFAKAEIIVQVRAYGAEQRNGAEDLPRMREGQVVIGTTDPLGEAALTPEIADRKVSLLSMELIPRITRAQAMDVLSSMASIAGYKAVLLAASSLPKMFPMMMTAAGTIAPAKVFVLGAGVAGLNAIATAKRLGAIVHAYDVRPAVKEQVMSLGGKFVEIELDTTEMQDSGGYAKEQSEEFIRKQREMMLKIVAESDVVITTAAIPGKRSPILVTEEMVKGMNPGSVIVDLASERGGNYELTKHGETVVAHGVTIIGPENINSTVPYHASQMYSKNIATLLLLIVKEGKLNLDMSDEIIRDCLVTRGGEIVQPRVRDILGLPALAETADSEKKEA